MDKRKIAQLIFFLLVASFIIVLFIGPQRTRMIFVPKPKDTTSKQPDTNNIAFPIPLNHPNVGSAFLHYFLTGTLKEILDTQNAKELILRDITENSQFPPLIIGQDTRVEKISPPYGQNTAKLIKTSDLKPGLVVDISIEYDLRSQAWTIRDVFVPTDRNH